MTVFVVIFRSLVQVIRGRVKVFVSVVVTGLGVTVFVPLAVAEGTVKVVNGPVVETTVTVEVEVAVTVGVLVILNVTVGVYVVVACGPQSSDKSVNGC